MRVTMSDVAERAGTSVSTVSLVLNNRLGVSPEVRQAVVEAAGELGYQLPSRRSAPRHPVSRTISVVHFADSETSYGGGEADLFSNYLEGIRNHFQGRDVNWAFIANYTARDDKPLGFYLLKDKTLSGDGLILIGLGSRQDNWLLQQIIQDNIPAVVLSRHWPDLPISTVSQDHFQQARIALDHLLGLGHRKIACVAGEGDRHYDWFDWRLDCYRQTMIEANGQVCEELIAVSSDGAEAAKTLVARRPDVTAIWAIHDYRAMEAMHGLRELGLEVPRDVSVIGLDDSCSSSEGWPALTTVAFPHKKLGSLAAELLLRQIEDDEFRYAHFVVDSFLVERDSCAEPRNEFSLPKQ